VPSGYKHLAPSGAKARPFRTSDGTAAKLNLKMSKEEPLHHSGICPNCPADTDQRFLYKADERSGKYREAGKVLLYGRVEILSLFCCVGCGAILVYKTFLEDIVDVDNPNLHDPKIVDQKVLKQFNWKTTFTRPAYVSIEYMQKEIHSDENLNP
jgi:hypothetical protein